MDSPPNIILPSLIGINNQSTAPSASTINNGIPNPTTKTTTTNAASTATKTSSPFNGTSTINSTSFANGRPAATITNPSPPSNSSSPTPPIASSSTISITNGLTASTPPSTANPPSTTTPKPPPDIIIEQMDRFIKAAAFVAYKKFGAKIGIISCKYSFNLLQNNVADYISFNNEGSPSHILAPFYNKDRFVLAVFYGGDKHVGYYDSLKQPSTTDFFLVKYSIEKYLHPLNFVIAGSDFVNSTFNDNPFPRYANFHICRIVEEICFNGRTQLLKPFNIKDEVERIKKIIGMVSDHFWNGEWLPSLKEARVENVIQDVIMDSLSCNNENVLSTSSSSVTVINGEHVQSKTVSDSSPIVVTQSNGRISSGDVEARKKVNEAVKRRLNVSFLGLFDENI
uniref:Uncharacterized protein n=1 Tax=Panagrolaimus sp. ES5 TaxID=591445 RepID=A0AC34FMJ4_9BILA